ncbi:MAG: hypothetical protein IPQ08_08000 [Chitinophagaceae bacterium]|nr:hypothetical protein [Chitinophagaceae bacterium]
MRIIIICLFSLFCCSSLGAQQDTSFRLIRKLKGDFIEFTVDNLDNIYTLNSRNQVKKYNANGDSVAVFNDVRKFGQASLIDVSNPLKILLYYRDFATVVVLDRFLNAVNVVDLRRLNIFQARAIGQSYDNKIWVYDELENKLKKVDENGKLVLETVDMRQVLDRSISPVKIFDENRYVYVYDPQKAMYVFDYYGAMKNGILISGWNNLKVAGRFIYGSKGDSLYRYEIKTFLYDQWQLPAAISGSRSFNFTSDKLYALKKDELEPMAIIHIYSIK